uniref:Uncharacterized protein n=1 Tax=Anopheles epiroticus TaxID=199890 RepID=A0A182P777_9DIPT
MKQNSAKPTTVPSSKAGSRASGQHGHHHHQQHQSQQQMHSYHQQQMQQPAAVTFQQQPSYLQAPQHHQLQQPGCIVLPSGATPLQPQQPTYMMHQQSGMRPNAGTGIGPTMYVGAPMVQQTSQQAGPTGFSTPSGYLQATAPLQPSMTQVLQQRPNSCQPTVTDFVAGSGAVTAGYSDAHQPYKQSAQQTQLMQPYQEGPSSSYPIHMQSSPHPDGSTTEAHYFFGK